MGDKDFLFYTYFGNWSNDILPYTKRYPNSLVLHPKTNRIMHNGVLYGSSGGPLFVKGNNQDDDDSGNWTGQCDAISKYEEGLTIIFVPNVVGNETGVTLNISNLGLRRVYYTNNLPLTMHYSPGTPILLTYIGDEYEGAWKRADSDTLKTPVQIAPTGGDYYLTMVSVTSGLTDLYDVGNVLKFNYNTQTLTSKYFKGNLLGNAETATELSQYVYIWGQLFNGSSDVSGNIKYTGNITPNQNNIFNIGETSLYYNKVYGNYFLGRADGVKSTVFTRGNLETIYLLGHTYQEAGALSGTGEVMINRNVFITDDNLLHAPSISAGNSTLYYPQYNLFIKGDSYLNGDLIVESHIGVGIDNPTHNVHVMGTGYFSGNLTANKFIAIGGTSDYVLLANGDWKKWNTSREGSTLVARDGSGDIYSHQYFTDITDEDLDMNSIGSIYVTNGPNDTAIRKVSLSKFSFITNSSEVKSISKTLRVTTQWMDTGITTDLNTFELGNGTYIIQVDATAINNSTDLYPSIYSGILTIYDGTNNTTEPEEVILHRAGHSLCKRLYIRTQPTSRSEGYCKIQIASSHDFSQAYPLVFNFKKMI